ncbi:hypothetical protein ACE7GA_02615 [Roseomonas sp. CCTCC AB2023176]|uniref:hypothetical protein n=1 Tax=Roseomonas sp. CCTCC AB2023176 TaxID=3342640 RepID=UPI0035D5DF9C
MTAASVRAVATSADAAAFGGLPAALGGEAAGWAVALPGEARLVFDPRWNPALAEWHLARFVAERGGRVVGRIAAAMPRDAAIARGVGHFGFLALEEDPGVLHALLDAAAAWLRARGAARLRGPLSFSINHEVGARVECSAEGVPAMLRMPRNPGWLPGMLDAAGLARERDVLACTLTVAEQRHRARFAAVLARWDGARDLSVRAMRVFRMGEEVALLRDLYNDAWGANWGAMPVTEAEAAVMRRLLTPLLLSGRVFLAEWRGEAVGVLSLVPNLDEGAEAGAGPWRVPRLLLGGGRTARVPMLGVRRAWRGTPVSAMATAALLSAGIGHAERRGWDRVEVSWILEDNGPMLQTMARLPAPVTGRWRLWGMPLRP